MAIDSEDKRRNVQGYAGAFAVVAPRPDGGLDENDRKHAAGIYRGALISQAIFSLLEAAGVSIRFLVADTSGRVLTEINPAVHRVSWRWNGMGAMAFTMALTDPKLVPEYFVEGNRVLLSFDNGLPDWGGVLTGARDWSGASVTFEAYSAEWVLAQRLTARSRYFRDTPVGMILSSLVQEANASAPMGLSLGSIWQGGQAHSPDYNFKSLYDVAAESLVGNLSAGAFDVTPALENGSIVFYVNLYERQGEDKPGIALVEGRNISAIRYREIDEAVNVWHMAGEGDGWAADSRVYATAMNAESIARHGMREGFEMRSGVVEQATLDATAAKRLEETAWPTRVLGLSVVSEAPGRYGDYGIGDAVSCRLYSYGFGGVDGLFEVRAREFFPDDGVCDLVLLEAR